MSNHAKKIIGEAVFGTMRGLFASGQGMLAGINNSAAVFELRGHDTNSDFDLVPNPGEFVVFRRAVKTSLDGFLDIIAVATGANDLEGRRGFFGYCAAVEFGHTRAYMSAYEHIANVWKKVYSEYVHDDQFIDVQSHSIVPAASDIGTKALTYKRVDHHAPPIMLSALASDWDNPDSQKKFMIFDALSAAVHWGNESSQTIAIVDHPRDGAELISSSVIKKFKDAVREREEREHALRQAEEQERLAQEELRLRRDAQPVTFSDFNELKERVRRLEHKISSVPYSQGTPVDALGVPIWPNWRKNKNRKFTAKRFSARLGRISLLSVLYWASIFILIAILLYLFSPLISSAIYHAFSFFTDK